MHAPSRCTATLIGVVKPTDEPGVEESNLRGPSKEYVYPRSSMSRHQGSSTEGSRGLGNDRPPSDQSLTGQEKEIDLRRLSMLDEDGPSGPGIRVRFLLLLLQHPVPHRFANPHAQYAVSQGVESSIAEDTIRASN